MEMKDLKKYSENRYRSFGYAFRGFWRFVREETPAPIHLIAIAAVVIMGFWFTLSPLEWTVVVLMSAALLSAELLNSALEKLGNAITTEYNPLIGKAKDFAAAAVLVLSVAAVIIVAILFLPKIQERWKERWDASPQSHAQGLEAVSFHAVVGPAVDHPHGDRVSTQTGSSV